jgi:NADPH2:quinone reductase
MRAVVATRLGGPEVLELRDDLPEPEAGPGEVVIKVVSAAVNFADVVTTRTEHFGSAKPPFIPGREVAGVRLDTGEPVLALVPSGGYGEYVVAPEAHVFSAGDADLERAGGLLLASLTSYFSLRYVARVTPGETVLVTAAAGSVGITAMQVARLLGAGRIVGAASSPAKRDFALRNGADEVVDYADDFPPLDVTIDGIGEPIFGKCRAVTRQLGRIVGLGNAGGTDPDIPDYERQRRDNVITIAFSLRALRDEEPARFRALAEPALPLLSSGQIAAPVSGSFPLEEAGEAFARLARRDVMGKLLIRS